MDITEDFLVDDANDYSWGVNVSDGNKSVFLAGDINNVIGPKDSIALEVGKVDALKLGHHGLGYSNTSNNLSTLSPDLAIVTGYKSSLPDYTIITLGQIGALTLLFGVLAKRGFQHQSFLMIIIVLRLNYGIKTGVYGIRIDTLLNLEI